MLTMLMMITTMMVVMTKGIILNKHESKLNHPKRNEELALKFGWTMAILFQNCRGLRQNRLIIVGMTF
jgi:hypothetical protein